MFLIIFWLVKCKGGYYMIWFLIVGGILGWFVSLIIGKDVFGGVIGNIIVGIIGFWVGLKLFGSFGLVIGGYVIILVLIGVIILIFIVSFLLWVMWKWM